VEGLNTAGVRVNEFGSGLPGIGGPRSAASYISSKEVMGMPSWKCHNCGYTFDADKPPDTCPSCKEKCEFLDNTCYTPDCQAEGMDKRIK
jgi:rubredoxin